MQWYMQSNHSGFFTTHHLGHRGRVCGSGENDSGILFVLSLIHKYENPLTHPTTSKYDDGQENRNGTPESSDVSTREIPKNPVGEHETYSGRDGERVILQLRPPTYARGRNT